MGEIKTKIRRALPGDLNFIVSLEHDAFTTPWSSESLEQELVDRPDRISLVVEKAGRPLGYACVWIIADELHLVTIAVHSKLRRQGMGALLMNEIFDRGRRLGSHIVTLEVRAGNEAAIGLYRAFGFREVAIRPRYYPNDHEDAIVMVCDLPPI